MKNPTYYTATYTAHDHLLAVILFEECRINCGVDPKDIEWHDNPDTTNFTVTMVLGEDDDKDAFFSNLTKDLEKYLECPITLGEIITDN